MVLLLFLIIILFQKKKCFVDFWRGVNMSTLSQVKIQACVGNGGMHE